MGNRGVRRCASSRRSAAKASANRRVTARSTRACGLPTSSAEHTFTFDFSLSTFHFLLFTFRSEEAPQRLPQTGGSPRVLHARADYRHRRLNILSLSTFHFRLFTFYFLLSDLKKRRKGFRKQAGHRAFYTRVRITDIVG